LYIAQIAAHAIPTEAVPEERRWSNDHTVARDAELLSVIWARERLVRTGASESTRLVPAVPVLVVVPVPPRETPSVPLVNCEVSSATGSEPAEE
jgi:hypothetical protein